MGEAYVMAASQLIWQTEDVVHENVLMYSKVSGLKANKEFWRSYSTGSSMLLASFATECALKAISIQVTTDGSCQMTHDLRILWDDVEEYKAKICEEIHEAQVRLAGTRLGMITLDSVEDIIEAHRDKFEKGRYYNEKDKFLDLRHSIDLWQLALGTVIAARKICG